MGLAMVFVVAAVDYPDSYPFTFSYGLEMIWFHVIRKPMLVIRKTGEKGNEADCREVVK
jgi:hypothetical protein